MTPKGPNEVWQECDTIFGTDRWAILAKTIKLLSAAAIACTLQMKPQEAQAEQVSTIQTVGYVPPSYSDLWNITHLTEAEYNNIVNSFIVAIDVMPEKGDTEVINGITVVQILEWIKYSWNLEALFDTLVQEFSDNWWDARAALEKLYSWMNEVERMAVEHSEAISLWRKRFIDNTLLYNPSYTEGRLQRAPIDVKMERAWISFDHSIQAILRNDPDALNFDGLVDFVKYTEGFVEAYLMSDLFAWEFPQHFFEWALRIIASEERIAESEERIAESAERTALLEAESKLLFEQFREKVTKARSNM